MTDDRELISLDDAAQAFEVGKSTLHRWIREGLLQRYRRRGSFRSFVDRSELAKLVTPRPGSRGQIADGAPEHHGEDFPARRGDQPERNGGE